MRILFFILTFFSPFFGLSQGLKFSQGLDNFLVARRVPYKNDRFSRQEEQPIFLWKIGYGIRLEKDIVQIHKNQINIGAGGNIGVLPLNLVANIFLPIIGSGEKLNPFAGDHTIFLNYGNQKRQFETGYCGFFLDGSEYEYTRDYFTGFYLAGNFNTGGKTFIQFSLNSQKVFHEDFLRVINTEVSYYTFGFRISANRFF